MQAIDLNFYERKNVEYCKVFSVHPQYKARSLIFTGLYNCMLFIYRFVDNIDLDLDLEIRAMTELSSSMKTRSVEVPLIFFDFLIFISPREKKIRKNPI